MSSRPSTRYPVPGENAHPGAALALAALGLLSAGWAARSIEHERSVRDQTSAEASKLRSQVVAARLAMKKTLAAQEKIVARARARAAAAAAARSAAAAAGSAAGSTARTSAAKASCPPLPLFVFNRGARAPREGHVEKVKALVQWLARQGSDVGLLLEGHSDARGNVTYNLALSRARGLAVAALLAAAGARRDRITVRGFGHYVPLVGRSEDADEQRRVVVKIVGKTACAGAETGGKR
ncbi:MAG: OmpA family protein [Myxococcales bacterium]|nr:OmpA family protein [Myxococcales bacterium]